MQAWSWSSDLDLASSSVIGSTEGNRMVNASSGDVTTCIVVVDQGTDEIDTVLGNGDRDFHDGFHHDGCGLGDRVEKRFLARLDKGNFL